MSAPTLIDNIRNCAGVMAQLERDGGGRLTQRAAQLLSDALADAADQVEGLMDIAIERALAPDLQRVEQDVEADLHGDG